MNEEHRNSGRIDPERMIVRLVEPDKRGGHTIVVCSRILPGEPKPLYPVAARATCMGGCNEWVWLGRETFKTVQNDQALPVCHQCAAKLIPPGQEPLAQIREE